MNFILPQWLIDWIIEGINRFKMKRPTFFRNLSRVGDVMILLTSLPWALHQAELTWHFTVPAVITMFSSKLALGIGIGLKFASMLTVKTIPVAQTETGQVVTVLDKDKLPFTAKSEEKEVQQSDQPPPVVPEIPEPNKKP